MPFTHFDLEKLQQNLRSWSNSPPCAPSRPRLLYRPAASAAPDLYLYSNKLLDPPVVQQLQTTFDALPTAVKRCFRALHFTHASITTELDRYTPSHRDPDWVAGPNEQFYQLVNGSHTEPGTSHLFLMEPDTRPIRPGWLDQLVKVVEEAEPFWIRGSAFRPTCAISKTGFGGGSTSSSSADDECHQLGPEIAEHINGNALYHIGDPAFLSFLHDVRGSKFAKWPFDLAWLLYSRLPEQEPLRRSMLSKVVYTEVIQNLGATAFQLEPFRRENPRTYFVHSDEEGK